MRNEQVSQAKFALEIFQHVNDLRLNGNIQRGNGFIAHDKFRIYRKRPGDTNALTLPAGKLVRIAVGMFLHQPYPVQQLINPFALIVFGFELRVEIQRLADDIHYRHSRIQGGVGILENHLHFFAVWQQLFFGKPADILPVKNDFAFRGLIKPGDRPSNCGFAAAGFAHQAKGFVAQNMKVHVIHGFHNLLLLAQKPLRFIKILRQVFNL